MRFVPHRGIRAALLIGLVAAQACAPTRSPPEADPIVSMAEAARVFEAGYRGIVDRYIEPVSAETVASEGLRRLARLDSSLRVDRDGGTVALIVGGEPVARFAVPPPNDVAGWAKATANVCRAARRVSRPLAAADAETVYKTVFDGATSTLDVFSRYTPADQARLNRGRRERHAGIGVGVRLEGGVPSVTDVASDGAAALAGLRVGDRVTRIDGTSVAGLSETEVIDRLASAPGGGVALTVERESVPAPLDLFVPRARVPSATVDARNEDGIVRFTVRGFDRFTAETMALRLAEWTQAGRGRARG